MTDTITVRRTPNPTCYGCRGTGVLYDEPCPCVAHTDDCEPEGCVKGCLGGSEVLDIERDGDDVLITTEATT